MNQFCLLQRICGLSNAQAALWLNVSHQTVNSYRSDRRNAPEAILRRMAALHVHIEAGILPPDAPAGAHNMVEGIRLANRLMK